MPRRHRLPAVYKALQRQLGAARDDVTRDRLRGAIAYIGALYGLPSGPPEQDDGDMKRRRIFTRSQHRLHPRIVRSPPTGS